MTYIYLFLISCYLVLKINGHSSGPTANTPSGTILGTIKQSRLGRNIFAFRGIRYAQAPVGKLRFQPPVPVLHWAGIYNGTIDGPLCPQPTDDPISEDCLMLNVYTPILLNNTYNAKLPVLFALHAGGYYSVGSASYWLGPQYLLDQDIILVTTNYRLGSLGFLATGTKEAPGNNGLKDQVVALQWVRDNIVAFSGDSNSVTVMGYSAGAMSAVLHMMSPMAKGLFHKVIAMSYSPFGALPIRTQQVALAKKQARLVGCPDDIVSNIISCLKTVSYVDLGNSLADFAEFGYDPIIIWTPVIEPDFGQQRYLTDHPINLIRTGQFMKLPVITGITEYEFGYRAYQVLRNDTLTNQINSDWFKVAPIAFCYERNTEFSKRVSTALQKYYLESQPVSNRTLNGLLELYADSIIGFSVNRAAKLLSNYSNQPVYYYHFSYRGRYSHFYLDENNTQSLGAVHHDDLIYLFYIQKLFPLFGAETPPEVKMVYKLTTMWAHFAKYGTPIPNNNQELKTVQWTPFNLASQKYLDIGEQLTEQEKLYDERYQVWENLYPFDSYKHSENQPEYYS